MLLRKLKWFDKTNVVLHRLKKDPKEIIYGQIETLFGSMYCAFCKDAFIYLGFCEGLEDLHRNWPDSQIIYSDLEVQKKFDNSLNTHNPIRIYLKGTDLQFETWSALIGIGKSELVNYSDIALMVQKPLAVRAVANAIGKNPVIYLIPCHRVIRKDGGLGGFSSGLDKKVAFLDFDKKVNKS